MKCPMCGQRMRKTRRDYQYEESGLDNIILKDMVVYVCRCGEEEIDIPAVECLHRLIADRIAEKSSPLTGPEIRFLRKEMRYKANIFSSLLRINKVTLSRWENDVKKPGPAYDFLIRLSYIRFREEQTGKYWAGIRFEELLQGISQEVSHIPIVIPQEKWEGCLTVGGRC